MHMNIESYRKKMHAPFRTKDIYENTTTIDVICSQTWLISRFSHIVIIIITRNYLQKNSSL